MKALDLIEAIAPELAGDANLDMFIELAAGRISASVFGKQYVEAVAYLAAHLLTMSKRAREMGTAAGGQVANISTGGLSVGFAQGATPGPAADEALKATHYGQEFLTIRAGRAGVKGRLIIP